MSLELALERNTAALNTLIEVLSGNFKVTGTVTVEETVTVAPPAEPPKAKRAKKETVEEPTAPSRDAGATDAPETAAAATVTEAPATYEQAAAAVTALIKANGRDAAIGLLKRFGAQNLKGVDPAQYSALIIAANGEAVPF